MREEPILNLCPGMKCPLTCRQTGPSGSNHVTPPVFAVRNGVDGPIKVISAETAGYDVAAGRLNNSSAVPSHLFYLVIDIKMEDNNKQFVCVDADNSRNEAS